MERGKIDDVLSMIETIEEKNDDLEKLISSLLILSRKDLLEEITKDIIEKNDIMKNMGVSPILFSKTEPEKEPHMIEIFIENTISEIKEKPSNQIIILKGFLDRLSDISDNDKNVMLQTMKDSKVEEIKEKLTSLTKIFKVSI